jgi:hypothetical protein
MIQSRCLAVANSSRYRMPGNTSPSCPRQNNNAEEWQAAMQALMRIAEQDLSDRDRPTCTSEAGRVAARRSLRAA